MVRRLSGGIFLTIWIVFWSAATLIFDGFAIRSAWRQLQVIGYPTVRGTVTHSAVSKDYDGESTTFEVDLKYTYVVNDQAYVGTKYRYGQMKSNDGTAHRFVRAHPPGTVVTVHHDPANPADAVLVAGLEGQDLFLPLFLTPFNVIMIGAWMFAWRALRPPSREVRVRTHGEDRMVRMPVLGPVVVFGVTLAAVAFTSVFIIAFTLGMSPPVRVMAWIWAGLLGVALLAAAYHWRRVLRGDFDLRVEHAAQLVHVPYYKKRKLAMTVPQTLITQVLVQEDVRPDDEGDTTTYFVPVLEHVDADGQMQAIQLAEYRNQDEADNVVRWLRQEIGLPSDILSPAQATTG